MAIILLIRHGENDMVGKKLAGRLPDVHLNEKGKAQAYKVAAELADLSIKAVYASPLERAVETAEPIAESHGLSVETLPELLEIDFGQWEGKRLSRLKHGRQWKIVQGSPSEFRFPDGESFVEAQARVATGLTALSEKYDAKDLVVCAAHSDVIRLAVAHFLGLPLNQFQRIRIAPASVTVLYLNGGEGFFGPINQVSDLSTTI
jgi:probable phosphomutase (TIGR03848 family)